ncbi:MAG: CDP-archaeol synthase [Bacteroidales bacterium]|nr:CDP-archaeol synthase [Bacteroidales bacterium]
MKPANFRTRTLTALVFGVLMVGSIILGSHYFAFLMLVTSYLGIKEFYNLVSPESSAKSRQAGAFIGILTFVIIFAFNANLIQGKWLWSFPVLLTFPFLIAMFDKIGNPVQTIGATLAGIVFIFVPLSLFASLLIVGDKIAGISGKGIVLIFLLILWVYDSAAYIIGSWLGKHKLFERLSPGKTWEGTLGGMVIGGGAALVISTFYTQIPFYHWLTIAFLIMVSGTMGDLCESMLKRKARVKDSGSLLPGHGGILDRFDAMLLSAPVAYLYIVLF